MLLLPKPHWLQVVAHCLEWLPLEACGLLAGRPVPGTGVGAPGEVPPGGPVGEVPPGSREGVAPSRGAGAYYARRPGAALAASEAVLVEEVYPTANAAASARVYTVEPRDLLRADRAAEQAGLALVGVWHSHTHTPAYPSPTDVDQAPDPSWHYVLVSLSAPEPVLRSYRIVDGVVSEEPVYLA